MTQREKFLEGARRRLEDAALIYARMKALGEYIDEQGFRVRLGHSDISDYTEMFKGNLVRAAEDLFAEISMTPLPERKSEIV